MDEPGVVEYAINTILRVPPLFIVDSILKYTFLWPWVPDEVSGLKLVFWAWFNILCSLSAAVLFMLDKEVLVRSYKALSLGTNIMISFYFNKWFIEEELKKEQASYDVVSQILAEPLYFVTNLAVQVAVSATFSWFQFQGVETQNRSLVLRCVDNVCRNLYFAVFLPLLLRSMCCNDSVLKKSPTVACILVTVDFVVLAVKRFPVAFQLFRDSFRSLKITFKNFGLQVFLELQWTRLQVPNVLRLFWFVRTVYIFSYLIIDHHSETNTMQEQESAKNTELNSSDITNQSFYELIKNTTEEELDSSFIKPNSTVIADFSDIIQNLLILSCDTVVALMGMTSIISYISHFVGIGLALYVQSNSEEDRSLGTMTAILFFILALQTGLTTMKPEKRLIRLYRNLYLLFTAVLHFTHGMVNPVLMTLCASQHHQFRKHIRPLSMCLFLMVFPVVFLTFLWRGNVVGTWLLAVTAFSIEVMIKVSVSLLVYMLFMIDAYRDVFWEKLDEYVYIVKACGNTVEFIFGIFLFCNGAWIMIFESGGTIRAVMMCVHAYFNIWLQAKEGWNTFIKRRSAVKKIHSLPEATPEQLEQNNDVCAICYQDLHSARVTRCNHYFHSVCLRKWLYMQDVCPLCHEEVYAPEAGAALANKDIQPVNNLHQD